MIDIEMAHELIDDTRLRLTGGLSPSRAVRLCDAGDALIAEVERLRAELDHLTENAGTDSCADYAARNAELTAEVERLRKVPAEILRIYANYFVADNVLTAKMVRVARNALATSPPDTDTVMPAPRSRED